MDSKRCTDSRRIAAVITVLAAMCAVLLTFAPAPPAEAGLRGCVSSAEWSRVAKGMPRREVTRIFGTSGVRDYVRYRDTGHIIERRSYRACPSGDRAGTARIRFRDGHLYDGLLIG